jgi:site-specific DNA-methyltransferase (adenine-specific)
MRKYRTVVIDPPWQVCCNLTNVKFYRTGKKLPYGTMSDAEIAQFPINDFAEEECDLFMWTTHTKLPIALKIIEAWGFKYHVLLTWDKEAGVCINGFYRKTELVVYGYRGKQGIDVKEGHYLPTLFRQKATEHSQKPSVFYELLRQRTLEPRIDIFARKRHYGFDAYGDQVESHIEVPLSERVRV